MFPYLKTPGFANWQGYLTYPMRPEMVVEMDERLEAGTRIAVMRRPSGVGLLGELLATETWFCLNKVTPDLRYRGSVYSVRVVFWFHKPM